MKATRLFFALAAVVAVCSCGIEENGSEIILQKPIVFNASTVNVRAAEVKINDLAESSFGIDSFYSDGEKVESYFRDASLTCSDGTWVCSKDAFWPRTGMLTFFSHYPEELALSFPESLSDENMAPSMDYLLSNQVDILYATTKKSAAAAYDGTPGGSTVNINLRHALSELTFSVNNTNPDWIIYISNIKISNIMSSGHFTYPEENDGFGTWSDVKDIYEYPVEIPMTEVDGESENVVLTNSQSGAVFMIPQSRSSWDPSTDKKNEAKGSYLIINCRILQKVDSGETIQLWPSTLNAFREVAAPVSIDWEQGKKYTYTISFGKGAGYVPPTEMGGGGESILPGENALNTISYDVNVSEFSPSGSVVTL